MDGVARRRGGVLERLLHVGGEPVVLRAAQPSADRVVLGAWAATSREGAERGLARLRFGLGVDDDLGPFLRAFRDDPWIGPSVRRAPWIRPPRRAVAFEALAWAICEQLIEFERATAIERRIVHRLGRRCPRTGLRDVPDPATIAGIGAGAPAVLRSRAEPGDRPAPLRARGRDRPRRPRRPRPRDGLGQAAADPRRRAVDDRHARAAGPGPPRRVPGRRPRVPQAHRAPPAAAATPTPARPRSRCARRSRRTGAGRARRRRTRCGSGRLRSAARPIEAAAA